MRSSKSRSRSKSNRQRSVGNVVNRVFDSSGPEGKVRGTPQQIIDKYLALARDAQLSNDRVAEQNFLQHAEHYTRLLGEAQREQQREQEQRQAQQNQGGGGQNQGQNNQQGSGGGRNDRGDDRREETRSDSAGAADVIDVKDDGESTLVETPETARSDDQPQTDEAKAKSEPQGGDDGGDQPKPRRGRPRGPRKPKGGPDGDAPKAEPSAAE